MRHDIHVAQIRFEPRKGEVRWNTDRLMSVLAQLAGQDVDAVVTPECVLDGYAATEASVTREDLLGWAVDPATSAITQDISAWCAARGTWVVLGCTRREGEQVFNSTLVYDRAGRLAGVYDKLHCQTHDQKFTRGDRLGVFESDFGRFGVMICADRRWPETVRALARAGARVIFNPTYGMRDDLNLAMMRTRSFESEMFIVFTHPRQSLVTGPRGEVIRDTTDSKGDCSLTTIDLREVDRAREGPMAHLRDCRTDVYGI
ncbi:MAG: carbon-nitrogen hydrolase family protein [Phycisphaeraceae bacterium]|nr:carbon-nitrogen hydrolase family protein [Phycisphaeraceae bacterium]